MFVAEADESDRSFHRYKPDVAVVLNIEEDHHDQYNDVQDHIDAYLEFIGRIRAGGTLVACIDDYCVQALLARVDPDELGINIVTYGSSKVADVRIEAIDTEPSSSKVTVAVPDHGRLEFSVGVPGAHMAHNAVAALVAGVALGTHASELAKALGTYKGISRRFTSVGEHSGVLVTDSYAHHPTQVTADLATARTVAQARHGQVLVVFQPHLYSRTAALGAALGRALAAADQVMVPPIYGGREDPISGVTHHHVADAASAAGVKVLSVAYDLDVAARVVASDAFAGDVVMSMGAGDITTVGPRVLDRLLSYT